MAEDPEATPATPNPYLARVPDGVLNGFQALFTLARTATKRFWQPDPRLQPWAAQVEALTGLTEAEVARLNTLYLDRPAIAREAVLRPATVNRYCALALALTQSGLSESPVVPSADLLDDGVILRFAAFIFKRLETYEDAQIVDFPLDFELPAEPAPAPEAAAPAETPAQDDDEEEDENDDDDALEEEDQPEGLQFTTGDQLRLERLQLESLIERADPDLREVAQSDVELYLGPDAPDEADTDPDAAEFYHDPDYPIQASPPLMHMLVMASAITSFWYLHTTIPFARAASQVRWMRRRAATEALRERLMAHNPEENLALSLAELLTLYQMMQVLALAGLNDLMVVFEEERRQQTASRAAPPAETAAEPEAAQEKAEEAEEDSNWLVTFFDPSTDDGQYFYHAVSSFTKLAHDYLTSDDEKAELAKAQAEIAALAEQFES